MRACVLGAFVATMLCAGTADAGVITVSGFVGVNVGYFFDPIGPGENRAVLGSVQMSNGSGLPTGLNAPAAFEAYCVDIFGPIFFPDDVALPNPPAAFSVQADLMSNWTIAGLGTPGYGALVAQPNAGEMAAYLYNKNAASFGAGDLTDRTALLMSIWEVLFDDDFSLLTGRFHLNPSDAAVVAAGTLFLVDLQANLANLGDASWLQLDFGAINTQDFVGPAAASTPVPEPGTLLLLSAGIAAAAVRRRAQRRVHLLRSIRRAFQAD